MLLHANIYHICNQDLKVLFVQDILTTNIPYIHLIITLHSRSSQKTPFAVRFVFKKREKNTYMHIRYTHIYTFTHIGKEKDIKSPLYIIYFDPFFVYCRY